jgi:hypothetical protein
MARKRYCGPCDEMVKQNPCERCGADTDPWPDGGDDPLDPTFRGRERSVFDRETQARIQRELK